MKRAALCLTVVLTAAGCKCSNTDAAKTIGVASGSGQTGVYSTTLALPAVALVTRLDGTAVSGVTVTFTPSEGDTIEQSQVVTDANGKAQTSWSLGPGLGAHALTATGMGTLNSAIFEATAIAGPPVKLVVTAPPGNGTLAAPLSPVEITAKDKDDHDAPSFVGPVEMRLGNNPGEASLSGTTPLNAVAGVATFVDLQINEIGTGYTLVASSAGLTSATTAPFDIVAAPLTTHLVFTTQPRTTIVGQTLSPGPVVTVRDPQDNTLTTFTGPITVAFAANPGNATLGGTTTVNAVDGVATFSTLTVDKISTGYQLVASASGLSSVTSTAFSVTPGPPATLVLVSGGSQTGAPGVALAQPVIVRVADAMNNPYAGLTVAFATTGGGSLAPASAATDTTGQAQSTWTLGSLGGTQTITVTAGTLTPLTVTATATGGGSLIFSSISAGTDHACGVTTSDAGYCWGNNSSAQLGTGSFAKSDVPAAVVGGLSFTSISTGWPHTCGLATTGAAYCWGTNTNGGLGVPTPAFSQSPVAVSGGLTFTQVSAGQYHTCGVATGGAAYCWGENSNGGLGNNSMSQSMVPVPVSGGLNFASVSAGGSFSCGVTTTGEAYCWGGNGYGMLGDNSFMTRQVPVAVYGGGTYSMVSCGQSDFTCGLTTAGAAFCWGFNGNGELGITGAYTSNHPVAVSGALVFTTVSSGGAHSCGLTASGAAYCWGAGGNALGAGADAGTANAITPVPVAGGLTFASISAGDHFTCGVTTGHVAYCWGNSADGRLGAGPLTMDAPQPLKVSGQP